MIKFLMIVALGLLAGCTQEKEERWGGGTTAIILDAAKSTKAIYPAVRKANEYVSFWKDPETGCEYLLYGTSGITPRVVRSSSTIYSANVMGCRND